MKLEIIINKIKSSLWLTWARQYKEQLIIGFKQNKSPIFVVAFFPLKFPSPVPELNEKPYTTYNQQICLLGGAFSILDALPRCGRLTEYPWA